MSPLEALPWIAFLAALASTGLHVAAMRRPDLRRAAHAALLAAAACGVLTFVALAALFLAGAMEFEEVFLHSHTTLAPRWRLAGAWTGQEGSLVLWAAWTGVVAAAYSLWSRRPSPQAGHLPEAGIPEAAHAGAAVSPNAAAAVSPSATAPDSPSAAAARHPGAAAGHLHLPTAALLCAGLAAFLGAVACQAPFDATPGFALDGRPDGNGLSPSLRSPYMLIHPPLMFLAYALLAIPAATALAHLATGRPGWGAAALPWTRSAWLVYTVAMGLGGLWAYTTLGFGGYWAWDPVEVANLLPWIALTAYVHAGLHNHKHGSYAVAGPLLAILPLVLTLLSTLSTRSGLWVSVHAFTDPTNTFSSDPMLQFLDILDAEPGLAFPLGLGLVVLLGGLALWCHHLAATTGHLRAWGRMFAVLLAALAGWAAADPASFMAATFQAAHALGLGRTGPGLLALLSILFVGAALPSLTSAGPHAPVRRLDLRGLNYASILILSSSLLALFLFHMSVTRALSEDFYLRRLPLFAAPLLLGLLAFLSREIVPPRRLLALLAGVAALAAIAAWALRYPPHASALALLALAPVAFGLERLRRAASAPAPRRTQAAHALLLAGALLDLAFWLNPPDRLWLVGAPSDALHVVAATLSILAVAASLARMAGAPIPRSAHAILVGVLAGYGIAAGLAALAAVVGRRTGRQGVEGRAARLGKALGGRGESGSRFQPARLQQAGLHLTHLAIAVALLGYAVSTGVRDAEDADLAPGETVRVGGIDLTLASTSMKEEAGTPYADHVVARVVLAKTGDEVGQSAPRMRWERQPGIDAYLARPDVARLWDRDVHVVLESVTVAPGTCAPEARTVDAFQATARLCADDRVESVRIDVTVLPAVTLVWLSLALLPLGLLLLALPATVMGGQRVARPLEP